MSRPIMTRVLHFDTEPSVGRFDRLEDMAQEFADQLGTYVFYFSKSESGSSSGRKGPNFPS